MNNFKIVLKYKICILKCILWNTKFIFWNI